MDDNIPTQDDIGLDVFKHRLTWELLLEINRDISSILDHGLSAARWTGHHGT